MLQPGLEAGAWLEVAAQILLMGSSSFAGTFGRKLPTLTMLPQGSSKPLRIWSAAPVGSQTLISSMGSRSSSTRSAPMLATLKLVAPLGLQDGTRNGTLLLGKTGPDGTRKIGLGSLTRGHRTGHGCRLRRNLLSSSELSGKCMLSLLPGSLSLGSPGLPIGSLTRRATST